MGVNSVVELDRSAAVLTYKVPMKSSDSKEHRQTSIMEVHYYSEMIMKSQPGQDIKMSALNYSFLY